MRLSSLFVIAATALCMPSPGFGGNGPHIELTTGSKTIEGQNLAHDSKTCVVMTCDGQIEMVQLDKVTKFRKVSSRFEPWNMVKFRYQLQEEFGKQYKFAASKHYLVCGQGNDLQHYSDILETLYRSFYLHFRTRGFAISEPDLALVVIIFPDFDSFSQYASKSGIRATPQLRGYYSPKTNRIAMWNSENHIASSTLAPAHSLNRLTSQQQQTSLTSSFAPQNVFGSVNSSVASTLIHEATHQAAFNLGLHSRICETPRWIAEGLATNFEIEENRSNSKRLSPIHRINKERYLHFGNYSKTGRSEDSLKTLITSDASFESATLDAYSEAWALTFFLLEKRSRNYAEYLKLVANRDEFTSTGPQLRLKEFQEAFGDDLQKLDREFLAFISCIE